jgi:hypothetical protein
MKLAFTVPWKMRCEALIHAQEMIAIKWETKAEDHEDGKAWTPMELRLLERTYK